jgi:hypothetical protein
MANGKRSAVDSHRLPGKRYIVTSHAAPVPMAAVRTATPAIRISVFAR